MFFELQLITLLTVAVKHHIIYRPFAHFRLDSKIIHFLHVFVGVASLYADKSVHFMQSSTKKKLFFSYSEIYMLKQLKHFLFAIQLSSDIMAWG